MAKSAKRSQPRREAEVPVPAARAKKPAACLLPLALLAVTAAAYQPALYGGPLWDDPAHITPPHLRSLNGLWQIWTDVGATQQYYPFAHSAFWLQAQLWGDYMFGYHLANIVLHVAAALLIALIMRRIQIPGAVVAAVLFALHPVHVESVAWVSELKNTLSTTLYLLAAWWYLRFDESRTRRLYAIAFALFMLALLTKTVTATLPAALLIVFWWRRGRLRWRTDVVPLVPFFAAGAAAGLLTLWVERNLIGAAGAEYSLRLIERFQLAGRAVWFYLGKLLLPAELTFVYPRWQISQSVWWQYLFLLALLVLAFLLWRVRQRNRAPFATLLLFCAGLFPALGFFDVFPFRYSYVADHFQYLASIPVLVFAAAAVMLAVRRLPMRSDVALALVTVVLAAPLFLLTRRQSADYTSEDRLYRATLARNPAAWLAHNNLARLLLASGRIDEARSHIVEALRLNPDVAEHQMNVGRLLIGEGRLQEGMAHLERALRIDPDLPDAHSNLGVAWLRAGRPSQAVTHFERALRIRASHAEARSNLALAHHLVATEHLRAGRISEAIEHLRLTLALDERLPDAHNDLGAALQMSGVLDSALFHLREAVSIKPDYASAHFNLALALQQTNRIPAAVTHYREALRYGATDAIVYYNLGTALLQTGDRRGAEAAFREAAQLDPGVGTARRFVR